MGRNLRSDETLLLDLLTMDGGPIPAMSEAEAREAIDWLVYSCPSDVRDWVGALEMAARQSQGTLQVGETPIVPESRRSDRVRTHAVPSNWRNHGDRGPTHARYLRPDHPRAIAVLRAIERALRQDRRDLARANEAQRLERKAQKRGKGYWRRGGTYHA